MIEETPGTGRQKTPGTSQVPGVFLGRLVLLRSFALILFNPFRVDAKDGAIGSQGIYPGLGC